jgi:hypothetical protein
MSMELVPLAALAATTGSARTTAWICFGVGLALVLAGVALGAYTSVFGQGGGATIDDAKKAVDDTAHQAQQARTAAHAAVQPGAEALAAPAAATAADQAAAKAAEAKSALDQVSSIVASLPENLRFAGMLVLVGTVLMSVATIQFGGVSLF